MFNHNWWITPLTIFLFMSGFCLGYIAGSKDGYNNHLNKLESVRNKIESQRDRVNTYCTNMPNTSDYLECKGLLFE